MGRGGPDRTKPRGYPLLVPRRPKRIRRPEPNVANPDNIRPNATEQRQEPEQQQQQPETEDEKNRRESEIRVPPEVAKEFKRIYHGDRTPPNTSEFPAEFLCIHCHKVVKQCDNKSPWAC